MSSSSAPQPTLNGAPMDSEHFSPYRPDGKLYGFVCVVTGATQPIGRAIVHELAACSPEPDAHPAYTSLAASVAAAAHPSSTTKLIPYPLPPAAAADEDATLSLIDDVLNSTGRLDVWVAASSGPLGPPAVADTGPDDLRRCFEANAAAPFWALKYAAPAMRKTTTGTAGEGARYAGAVPKEVPWGSIVVIDMGIDLKGFDMRGVSSQQLPPSSLQSEKGLATDEKCLPCVKAQKEHIGLERAGLPQEVGKVVGFLASGFSSYITGANLVVDGGATTMNPLTVPI
ncbi:hypothetical protein SLS58_007759 [Diplodia intermedia]|uniref:Peroxisomal trans-2-enoyl-CoA reductase n=1 Tax=Diplodia intermedia TaxID=856260 RepID=A0ABR3TJH2_9PEZI